MKRLLLKLRFAGALVCAFAVGVLLVVNLWLFITAVANHLSVYAVYGTFKTIWWLTLATAVFSALGNWLYVAKDVMKAEVLVFSGLCGMFSFFAAGAGFVLSGFAAGKVWLPIIMIFVTFYACFVIFFGTSYFARCLRKDDPYFDEDYSSDMSI